MLSHFRKLHRIHFVVGSLLSQAHSDLKKIKFHRVFSKIVKLQQYCSKIPKEISITLENEAMTTVSDKLYRDTSQNHDLLLRMVIKPNIFPFSFPQNLLRVELYLGGNPPWANSVESASLGLLRRTPSSIYRGRRSWGAEATATLLFSKYTVETTMFQNTCCEISWEAYKMVISYHKLPDSKFRSTVSVYYTTKRGASVETSVYSAFLFFITQNVIENLRRALLRLVSCKVVN